MPSTEDVKKWLQEAHEWWEAGGTQYDLCDLPEDEEEDELHFD